MSQLQEPIRRGDGTSTSIKIHLWHYGMHEWDQHVFAATQSHLQNFPSWTMQHTRHLADIGVIVNHAQALKLVVVEAFIVVIAGFVTIVQMLMQAFVPSLYASLGLFIPLIVVNCIVLGRAEAVAAKQGVLHSALDGVGIGLGFTLSLTVLGLLRELLGSGAVFTLQILPKEYGALLFVLAPGAFLVLGYLIALKNKFSSKK